RRQSEDGEGARPQRAASDPRARRRGHRMRRRTLLALAAGGVALGAPRLAIGQVARIGFVGLWQRQDSRALLDAFRAGMAALGWNDGGNMAVVERWAEGSVERLPALVAELVGGGVDLLVSVGPAATLADALATTARPI